MSLRKIVLALLLIGSICLCYFTAVDGLSLGSFNVSSYTDVEKENKDLEQQISELARKNNTDYDNKKTALSKAIKDYNDAKEQYDAISPTLANIKNEPEVVDIGIKPYDVEYLLVTLGEYGTKHGVSITFNIVQSSSASNVINSVASTVSSAVSSVTGSDTTNATDLYTMADIDFSVSGEYNSIIEFIYSLEDDDELAFEISGFKMGPGGGGVQTTFSARNVPVSTKGLSNLQTANPNGTTDENGETSSDGPLNIEANAVNKNLISDDVKQSMNSNTSTNTSASTNTTN